MQSCHGERCPPQSPRGSPGVLRQDIEGRGSGNGFHQFLKWFWLGLGIILDRIWKLKTYRNGDVSLMLIEHGFYFSCYFILFKGFYPMSMFSKANKKTFYHRLGNSWLQEDHGAQPMGSTLRVCWANISSVDFAEATGISSLTFWLSCSRQFLLGDLFYSYAVANYKLR